MRRRKKIEDEEETYDVDVDSNDDIKRIKIGSIKSLLSYNIGYTNFWYELAGKLIPFRLDI